MQRFFDTHLLVGAAANSFVDFKNSTEPVQTFIDYIFRE